MQGIFITRGLLGFISFFILHQAIAETVEITTFNVKWYGNQSNSSDVSIAERDQYLKEYIQRRLSNSDVIVFQEIVDPKRLHSKVLGRSKWNCYTYSDRGRGHQHIVLCHRKHLRFRKENHEDNFELEEVAMGSSRIRPGLHGVIETRSGKGLFHIMGVHLKAYPEESEKRLKQTREIAKHIRELKSGLPAVITGDFNSHVTPTNEQSDDDKVLMDEIFRNYRTDLERMKTHLYTFKNDTYAHQLDHLWVSDNVKTKSKVRVDGPCNENFNMNDMSFAHKGIDDDLATYNKYISDHCPVSIKLDF